MIIIQIWFGLARFRKSFSACCSFSNVASSFYVYRIKLKSNQKYIDTPQLYINIKQITSRINSIKHTGGGRGPVSGQRCKHHLQLPPPKPAWQTSRNRVHAHLHLLLEELWTMFRWVSDLRACPPSPTIGRPLNLVQVSIRFETSNLIQVSIRFEFFFPASHLLLEELQTLFRWVADLNFSFIHLLLEELWTLFRWVSDLNFFSFTYFYYWKNLENSSGEYLIYIFLRFFWGKKNFRWSRDKSISDIGDMIFMYKSIYSDPEIQWCIYKNPKITTIIQSRNHTHMQTCAILA